METKKGNYTKEDLEQALEVLKQGGLILYPTDTIWGIGCDATNAEAVEKAFRLKKRSDSKAMISIIDSNAKLQGLMREVPELAYELTEMATEPLTIIYQDVHGLAPNMIADDGSAGIRICDEPFCKELCMRFRKPIVSTSANLSGAPAARFFDEISDEIKQGVDYIVKYRQNDRSPHKASKILKLNNDNSFMIIR